MYPSANGNPERGYDPNQPRILAGDEDGGQWTRRELGQNDSRGNRLRHQAWLSAGATELIGDRPAYDTEDAALLRPRGVKVEASVQKLTFRLHEAETYLGGVTVTNEDRTAVVRFIQRMNRTPIDLEFEAEIRTADGVSIKNFRISKSLPPGGSVTILWKELGPMRGPGQVEIRVSNVGGLAAGVIGGAVKVRDPSGSR